MVEFDVTKVLKDKIMGTYYFTVFVTNPLTGFFYEEKVGDVKVDFGGNGNDGNNRKRRTDFELYDKIINIFDEPPPQKNPILPLLVSAIIVGMLLMFMHKLIANGANHNNFSGWGFLFTVNYLVIYLVIIAFWFKINLINTLWFLLALTPLTLFTMNKGLTADNCHISGFHKKSK